MKVLDWVTRYAGWSGTREITLSLNIEKEKTFSTSLVLFKDQPLVSEYSYSREAHKKFVICSYMWFSVPASIFWDRSVTQRNFIVVWSVPGNHWCTRNQRSRRLRLHSPFAITWLVFISNKGRRFRALRTFTDFSPRPARLKQWSHCR